MSRLERSAVVCSVLEHDAQCALQEIAAAPPGCSLIELRADRLGEAGTLQVLAGSSRPLIVTARSRAEGGGFGGSEEARRQLFEHALEAGAAWVDVEWGSPAAALAGGDRADRVILSHHGVAAGTSGLEETYRAMAATRAARLKIVPRVASVSELGVVRRLLERAAGEGRALACFAQGRPGAASRVLAPSWGSWATYGSTRTGKETAEGQFSARDLLELYRVDRIDSATRLFALIGSAVFGSPSPAMHGAAYRAAGVEACYLPVELDDARDFLDVSGGAHVLGLEGLAVTMPFKTQVAGRCRLDDPVARASGAVNTVCLTRGGPRGYNTDGPAAVERIRGHVDPAGARVALVGAGGTARAVAAALGAAGARVTLYGRDAVAARRVAGELGMRGGSLDDLATEEWSVLVNATPLGSCGESVLPDDRLRGEVVLDAVYSAGTTPLVRAAGRRGIAAVDGFELLTAQAVLQFERLVGSPADPAIMAAAGTQWLNRRALDGATPPA